MSMLKIFAVCSVLLCNFALGTRERYKIITLYSMSGQNPVNIRVPTKRSPEQQNQMLRDSVAAYRGITPEEVVINGENYVITEPLVITLTLTDGSRPVTVQFARQASLPERRRIFRAAIIQEFANQYQYLKPSDISIFEPHYGLKPRSSG